MTTNREYILRLIAPVDGDAQPEECVEAVLESARQGEVDHLSMAEGGAHVEAGT